MKITIGTRTDTFGIRIGISWKKRLYAYWYHNTTWKNGNFNCRAVTPIIGEHY